MPDNISLIPKDYREEKFSFGNILSKMGFFIAGLAVLSLLVYGGLFLYDRSLTNQINSTISQIEELNKRRDADFEKKVVSLEKSLRALKFFLNNHFYWSSLFSKIEKLVIVQASFNDFNAQTENDGSVTLMIKGNTASYTHLAKQMVSLANEKLIAKIEVSGITLSTEGGIDFNLNINFLKGVLEKQ